MRAASLVAGVTLAVGAASMSGACTTKQPQPSTYFDRSIAPIVESTCVRTNTGVGCHVTDAKGNAFGNLDLETFAGVDRRRDLLLDYGPYLQPSLLVKNVPPYQVTLVLWDGTTAQVTTDIRHAGGPIFDPTASAYSVVRRWIENGATVDNTGVAPTQIAESACNQTVPAAAGFDPTVDPTAADFATFQQGAGRVLAQSCSFGNCHGTSVNALYLTCGQTPEQVRWNYFAAVDYLSATPELSEIVRRPLAAAQGGSFHEGGALFTSVMDPSYQSLVTWARAHGPPQPQPPDMDPAFLFFARRVQPMLVKKGCMMAQCHSAAMFHDYRLRGGSAGSFSLAATRKNYALSIAQMSFESDDVNASRLVRKNLYRPEVSVRPGSAEVSNGIAHRGGALFEDFGGADATTQFATGAVCDSQTHDYDNDPLDSIPAYCMVREWHSRERAERNPARFSEVVYVQKPPPAGADSPQDFDVFSGGASLHLAQVTQGTGGGLTLGADRAVDLTTCGLGASPDVRRPSVSWDATLIAFAARSSDADPLAIYTMNADGSGCAKEPNIAAHDPSGGGLLEHDFDPVFSPPIGGVERIVFASTRGNLDSSAFDYSGPQPTPADPTKPNANLYVLEPSASSPGTMSVRQLTYQLNMERMPNFMQDGRLIFTAEKREPGFYELALRRQNLDGSDYHPLYAQRASIGYTQATSVAELSYKDFVTIVSSQGAQHGAGALAVFNRSIGIDFTSTTPGDYPVDPTVIDPNSSSSPEQDFFLHSLTVVASDGSYTSPSPLPDGEALVSFGAGDPSTFGGDYDVYVIDPVSGIKTKLLGNPGTAEVDAVGVFARVDKGVFQAAFDEPNGHTEIRSADPSADITVLSAPVLASLLFQNTPTGRLVEADLPSFDVYEDLPPDVSSFPDCGGNTACDAYGKVYVRRRLVGTVPILSDGSAHFRIPGGMPMVLHLADDIESRQKALPRWQREEMTFLPGEYVRQSLPPVFFDHLCAGCHGSISGLPIDAALSPDILTQASQVLGVSAPATDLSKSPSQRGTIMGPPSSP